MTDLYVLEWSQSTNNFHIQPLANVCAANQMAFIEDKRRPDYHILFVGEKESVHRMADQWRDRVSERERVRNLPRPRAI